MTRASLAHLAEPGARIAVHVTPRAGSNGLAVQDGGAIRIRVTAPPEDGRATEAARRLLARTLAADAGDGGGEPGQAVPAGLRARAGRCSRKR
jgi:uncharacterized protein YggU (UPF0235/DUF167 family)